MCIRDRVSTQSTWGNFNQQKTRKKELQMPHAFGYRARTRQKFSKPFRKTGAIRMINYLTAFRVGDYVDIVVDGAIHKGMPHNIYHGQTGKIFTVNPRSVGVVLAKQVKQRYMEKRIHIRVEHVRRSRCREAFVERIRKNDELKHAASGKGQHLSTKRKPVEPRLATVVKGDIRYMHPQVFKEVF
eukprot:TRINITY_DN396_c0_g1_i1.p1 TRINITY_DN396_c0_g1~~TRINITY_DN396_c0_g1_i1.p1  ORF type:complete len:185 (+),score=47.84 TRINITY_DN396_c0_g1_i1:68-622(+)